MRLRNATGVLHGAVLAAVEDWVQKWRHAREVRYNNTQIRYSERRWFFMQTFDYLKANDVRGDYYEFGCHKAMTFRMALSEAHRKNIDWMDFYAFDSFEGLPEPSEIDRFSGWQRGALCTTEERFLQLVSRHGLYVDRVHTVKGFYSESLTPALQARLLEKSRIALAFIDCDLYESARDVLRFIGPLLQKGSIVYFDDYFTFRGDPAKGEQRAFAEFQSQSAHRFNPHLQVGWFGRSFIVY